MSKTKITEWLFILFLLAVSAGLRFTDIGYSDYIPDETTVLGYLKDTGSFYTWDFFMEQRKGPMQFVVAAIPFALTGDVFNQTAQRVPFALAGTLSVLVFYFLVREITKSFPAALLSALLFGGAGFLIAFSRVVQYQSLNVLFSLLSFYFFYHVKKYFIFPVLGAVFFGLSVLSHWDAIFFAVPIVYCLVKYVTDSSVSFANKFRALAFSTFALLVIVLPFLIPYLVKYRLESVNHGYFLSRVGYSFDVTEKLRDYYNKYELYNPFGLWVTLLPLSLLSLINIRKSWIYWVWLYSSVLIFVLFVKSAGTHVYNLSIPLYFLAGLGLSSLLKLSSVWFKTFITILVLPFVIFLNYQSYLLFVDTGIEYPIHSEQVWRYKTKSYTHENLTNNKIGFTINRNWNGTREFFEDLGEDYYYVTNDDTSISGFYLDGEYGMQGQFYLIGVRRPFSLVNDYSFPQVRGKSTVHKVLKDGSTVARIYRYTRSSL